MCVLLLLMNLCVVIINSIVCMLFIRNELIYVMMLMYSLINNN